MVDVAWVALSLQPRIGKKTLETLRARFGSLEKALIAPSTELLKLAGIGKKTVELIQALDLAPYPAMIQAWQAAGIHIGIQGDSLYPQLLHDLADPPATLFIRGTGHPHLWQHTLGIVGTRTPSHHAQRAATDIGKWAANRGYTVISGLARGIDTAAHYGALSADQGSSVAVMGSGVLRIYPPENDILAQMLMERGLLLSENAPDASATSPRLVARNRIISGLSQTLIVIETEHDGGAMYAARFAQAQGRTLYVLDLPATGNQALLAQGAKRFDLAHPPF